MSNSPLRDFVVAVTHLADQHHNEPEMLAAVRPELAKLVAGVRAAHLKALELFIVPMQLHVLQKSGESTGPVGAGAVK